MSTPKQFPKIGVIVGPTASGKSELAIQLARKFGGEIISADSRQIYRGMDVGTAKPSAKERAAVPHYLTDVRDPDELYTAAEYKRDALREIREILAKKKLPILVGGTGLYISAVVDNLDIPKVKPNQKLRAKLEEELRAKGLPALAKTLLRLDPETASIVDMKNPRRVIRALEVARATRRPFTAQRKKSKPLFEVLKIGIALPKEELWRKIEARVDMMMQKGLVEEVKGLVSKYGERCPALDAIGYREIIDYLKGKTTLAAAVELTKRHTRAYAKRQMTWFKKDKGVVWVRNPRSAGVLAKNFLKT